MDNQKILTYYQSTLRTSGQYVLVSLALLSYSRFYRQQKNSIYNITFIILSLLILLIASLICYFLIKDIKNNIDFEQYDMLHKWLIIPKLILIINSVVGVFGLYTLVREINKLV